MTAGGRLPIDHDQPLRHGAFRDEGMSKRARLFPLWIRNNLSSSPASALLSVIVLAGVLFILVRISQWAILDGVWLTRDADACRRASGACWAVIGEKYRVMLFGFYPYDEHWRPALAIILFLSALAVSAIPFCWRWRVVGPVWLVAGAMITSLLIGGLFGLSYQEADTLGGLPLTLIIFAAQVSLGLPIGILLALGRRSELPMVRVTSVTIIEGVRAVPPIALLFFAAVVFPLFLPPGTSIDKLLRIAVTMVVLQACLQAEVVRGGLQAVPEGQTEAATALGLGYWPTLLTIVLPQALRIVVPGLTNQIIQAFKNSTLVIIVGMFDFLNTTSAAISDPNWISYFVEAYIFAAVVYFCGCWTISRYGRFLERHFKPVEH